MGKYIDKNISKNLSSKFWQKHLDYAKQSAEDDLKTASKKAIQKTTEATVDLIGNKSARILKNFLKSHHRILQKQLKVKQKYCGKNIYHLKEDRKLLKNQD